MAKYPKHIIKLPSEFQTYEEYANSENVVLPHIVGIESGTTQITNLPEYSQQIYNLFTNIGVARTYNIYFGDLNPLPKEYISTFCKNTNFTNDAYFYFTYFYEYGDILNRNKYYFIKGHQTVEQPEFRLKLTMDGNINNVSNENILNYVLTTTSNLSFFDSDNTLTSYGNIGCLNENNLFYNVNNHLFCYINNYEDASPAYTFGLPLFYGLFYKNLLTFIPDGHFNPNLVYQSYNYLQDYKIYMHNYTIPTKQQHASKGIDGIYTYLEEPVFNLINPIYITFKSIENRKSVENSGYWIPMLAYIARNGYSLDTNYENANVIVLVKLTKTQIDIQELGATIDYSMPINLYKELIVMNYNVFRNLFMITNYTIEPNKHYTITFNSQTNTTFYTADYKVKLNAQFLDLTDPYEIIPPYLSLNTADKALYSFSNFLDRNNWNVEIKQ